MDYHRALRSPLDLNSAGEKDKSNDKTVSDWVTYQGYRSSRQSNLHPRSLDPARLEELSKVIYSKRIFSIILRFSHQKNGMNKIQIIVNHHPVPVKHLNGLIVKMISIGGHVHLHYLNRFLLIGSQQLIEKLHHQHHRFLLLMNVCISYVDHRKQK